MARETEWVQKGSATAAIAVASRDNHTGGRHCMTAIDASYSTTTTGLLQVWEGQDDSVLQKGTLAIDAVPEKFKTTTTLYAMLGGTGFAKAAETAIVFTAAHPVTASKFGAILVQSTTAGVVTTLISGATQTTTQAYDTAAAAVAALPSPSANNLKIGHIIIEADSGGWTAITDDLTDASDLTTATFVDATETGTVRMERYVYDSYDLALASPMRSLNTDRALLAVLPAGAGGVLGKVNLMGYTI